MARESDYTIVPKARRAVHVGKKVTAGHSSHRKRMPNRRGRSPQAKLLEGDSTLPVPGIAEARLTEEPGTRKPHAGICAKGAGYPASLPRPLLHYDRTFCVSGHERNTSIHSIVKPTILRVS